MNFLADGEACPSCRARVLDAVPAALPGSIARQREEQQRDGVATFDLAPGDGYPDPPIGA